MKYASENYPIVHDICIYSGLELGQAILSTRFFNTAAYFFNLMTCIAKTSFLLKLIAIKMVFTAYSLSAGQKTT